MRSFCSVQEAPPPFLLTFSSSFASGAAGCTATVLVLDEELDYQPETGLSENTTKDRANGIL